MHMQPFFWLFAIGSLFALIYWITVEYTNWRQERFDRRDLKAEFKRRNHID